MAAALESKCAQGAAACRAFSSSIAQQDYLACLLRTSKDLSDVKHVHAYILGSVHRENTYLGNLLVQMYGKHGSLQDARKVFDGTSRPNAFSWNMMMAAYAQNGHMEEAKHIFDMKPSSEHSILSWTAMIHGYAKQGYLQEAKAMFDTMPNGDVVSWTAMVQSYAQNMHLQEAKCVFDRMPQWNAVSWNSLIAVYAQNGHFVEAKHLFDRMLRRDVVSWNAMITICAENGHFEEAEKMFCRMPGHGLVSWSATIQAYAQKWHLEEAKEIFDRMPERDIVSWNTMLQAYGENGLLQQAESMFGRMPRRSPVSWTVLIVAYARSMRLDEAKSMFDDMPQRTIVAWTAMIVGFGQNMHVEEARSSLDRMPEWNVVSCSAMVAAYAQNMHVEEAKSAFDKMPERNVVSWNTMLAAYGHRGHSKDAIQLFQAMDLEGVKPSEVSFTSILIACNHVGLLDVAWRYFVSMRDDYGIVAVREHYCSMVDILGRAGQLENAEELIHSMPFMPDTLAWGALLGACGIHRDSKRAAHVAKHVLELDCENAAPYVLLANIYAATGKQKDVALVRKAMKDRGINKQPGVSCIKIGGKLHKFTSGDLSHPQIDEICNELQRLDGLMKELGYKPETELVLHDVSGSEKQTMPVSHHSEKLALAFGLISTHATTTTPLRIVKNLRVCCDCHAAFKFISKLVERQVIVRDASRFHHFEQGMCSCGDYW